MRSIVPVIRSYAGGRDEAGCVPRRTGGADGAGSYGQGRGRMLKPACDITLP